MVASVLRSSMSGLQQDQLLQMETTCGSLLYELQVIWDEVGEPDVERDKMLLELEQECLEVYRRKVDQANKSRAQLRRAIAESEAELASICSAMGEPPIHVRQTNPNTGSLKEELKAILPQLEDMRRKKTDRQKQFVEIQEQLEKIQFEIGLKDYKTCKTVMDESDLSGRRHEELHKELEALQKEKAFRLKQVLDHLNTLHTLCLVLSIDFKHTICEIHPTLDNSESSKSISNETIERLASAIQRLRDLKLQRMQKLQDLASTMLELWNLMDTPVEEQQKFQNVTCNIAASEQEITEPDMLSLEYIGYVEAEVSRLEVFKSSKMKELVIKKKLELEELRRRTHVIAESDSEIEVAVEAIESGAIDPSLVLEQIEVQIANIKDEAFSRKEILDKVEKWLNACNEESWLEEYNRDDNRYSAGKGAHLTLKRAEKARTIVNKIPAMVEALVAKTASWEREKGTSFKYDGAELLSMLEDYTILRQEKEQERRRQRDQKKLQGQLIAEQEALYGSKPSPSKQQSGKKIPRVSMGGQSSSRRLTLGGPMQQSKQDLPHSTRATRSTRKADNALSSGRRGLDVAGLPVKKLSFNASHSHDVDPTVTRQPFTLISAVTPSKYNSAVITTPSKHKSAANTPSKPNLDADEENRTPVVMPMPPPKTPHTVTIPMLMSTTPAVQSRAIAFDQQVAELDEIEYSFEERRAGFTMPKEFTGATYA